MYEFEKYPVDSEGYVISKRKLAWDLAKQKALSDGINLEGKSFSVFNPYYVGAYMKISLEAYERQNKSNNYRRRHGLPMRRKVG